MPNSKERSTFGNLPIPLSTFIGRENEIREIHSLLLSNRLLSGLRAVLGEETCAALSREGACMQLEEVIDCALQESEALPGSPRTEKEKFGGLTAREREVAAWIAQGKSNREIAEAMTVGVKAVETYVTRILNKLGSDSRVQIATRAMENGLASSVNHAGKN